MFNFNYGSIGWQVMRHGGGVTPPAPVSDALIQWLKGGSIEPSSLRYVEDQLDPVVTSLAEYSGVNRYANFDGVGDGALWTGSKTIAKSDGTLFDVNVMIDSSMDTSTTVIEMVDSANPTTKFCHLQIHNSTNGYTPVVRYQSEALGNYSIHSNTYLPADEWVNIKFKEYTTGILAIYINDVLDRQQYSPNFDSLTFNEMRIGTGIHYTGSTYFQGGISNLKLGDGDRFPLNDAISGKFLSVEGEEAEITSTSSLATMQGEDADAPSLSPEYGGNLMMACQGLGYEMALDTIPDQGGDLVSTKFTLVARGSETGGWQICAGMLRTSDNYPLSRRVGRDAGGKYAVGGGAMYVSATARLDTNSYLLEATLQNGVNSTNGIAHLDVNGVNEINNTGANINGISGEHQIYLGVSPTGSSPWLGDIGAYFTVEVYNVTTSTDLGTFEYQLKADGSMININTGQVFTPTVNTKKTYVLPEGTTDNYCVNGQPLENNPGVLTSLGETFIQTDASLLGSKSLYSADGITFDDVTVESLFAHKEGDYQGCYGTWVRKNSGGKGIWYLEQYPLTNKLLPADVDLLEDEFNCVGSSGAIRDVNDDYVLDAQGYCTWEDYL